MRIFGEIMKYITLATLIIASLLLGYNISIGDTQHIITNSANLLSLSLSLYVFQMILEDY